MPLDLVETFVHATAPKGLALRSIGIEFVLVKPPPTYKSFPGADGPSDEACGLHGKDASSKW